MLPSSPTCIAQESHACLGTPYIGLWFTLSLRLPSDLIMSSLICVLAIVCSSVIHCCYLNPSVLGGWGVFWFGFFGWLGFGRFRWAPPHLTLPFGFCFCFGLFFVLFHRIKGNLPALSVFFFDFSFFSSLSRTPCLLFVFLATTPSQRTCFTFLLFQSLVFLHLSFLLVPFPLPILHQPFPFSISTFSCLLIFLSSFRIFLFLSLHLVGILSKPPFLSKLRVATKTVFFNSPLFSNVSRVSVSCVACFAFFDKIGPNM